MQVGSPSHKHLAGVYQETRNAHMLCVRNRGTFPANEQEELGSVQSCNRSIKSIDFLRAGKVSCTECILERIEECKIDTRTDSLAFAFRNVRQCLLPCKIRFLKFEYYRNKLLLRKSRGGVRSEECEPEPFILTTISFLQTICSKPGENSGAIRKERRMSKLLSTIS